MKQSLREPAKKRRINERRVRDPVCDMEVSRTTAVEECIYKGKAYYFCAGTCRKAFLEEPEKYIRHHRQRGVK